MFSSRFWVLTIALMALAFPGCSHSNAGPGPTLADQLSGVYQATPVGASIAADPSISVVISDHGDGTIDVAFGGDSVNIARAGSWVGGVFATVGQFPATSVLGKVVTIDATAAGEESMTIDGKRYVLRTPSA